MPPWFTTLREVGSRLIASGYVWPESGGRNVFIFENGQFTALSGGVSAISVDAIEVTSDALWFGGFIAEAGSDDELQPSVGAARFAWPMAE